MGGMPLPPIWNAIRSAFVEGVADESVPGGTAWPTLQDVAARFGKHHDTVRRRAAREKWTEQRRRYSEKLAMERREARTAAMLREAAEFDAENLRLAKALLATVSQVTEDATRLARIRERKLRAVVDDPDETASVLANPLLKAATPTGLAALASTLATAQKVGRLALGDTTEQTEQRTTLDGAVGVAGQVVAVHQITAGDAEKLAEIARALREAGVEQ